MGASGKGFQCQDDGDWFYLDIVGNRFLQHMVRKIAAALKLIGKGEKDGGWLEKIHELFISRETVARMLEEIERGMQ